MLAQKMLAHIKTTNTTIIETFTTTTVIDTEMTGWPITPPPPPLSNIDITEPPLAQPVVKVTTILTTIITIINNVIGTLHHGM